MWGGGVGCRNVEAAVCATIAGVIQLVECQLPKLDVAGSSPVARSDANTNGGLREGAAVLRS